MKTTLGLLGALALLCAAGGYEPAYAQTAQPVTACGSITYTANGEPRPFTQTTDGKLCTNANSSGSVNATIVGPLGTQTLPNSVATTSADCTLVTVGCVADSAWVSGNGTLVSLLKGIFGGVSGAIPAGTALIGKVGIDQTTPGTTNNVTLSTNVGTLPLVQATASVPITFTAAGGPTQIIAASGSLKVYITHIDYVLSGAGTFALITGTGTNCGTGTTYLEGASGHPLSFAANGGISEGGGLGPIYVTGAGGEVCAITTGAVDTSGHIAYAQF